MFSQNARYSLLLITLTVFLFAVLQPSLAVSPVITLNPAHGEPGTVVKVTGSNFDSRDMICTISSSPTGLIEDSNCNAFDGKVIGQFTVASGASGAYTVSVMGSTNDRAGTVFSVPTTETTTAPQVSNTQVLIIVLVLLVVVILIFRWMRQRAGPEPVRQA